jgi:predicted O-methyltransferase YrrM
VTPPADETDPDLLAAWGVGMLQHPAEVRGVLTLVRALRPRNLLEVGVWRGGTFYLWCRAAAPGGVKLALDWPAPGYFGPGPWALTAAELDARDAAMRGWAAGVAVLRADSRLAATRDAVAARLGGEPLDLLVLDGDHSHAGCRRDYALYRPLVRPGGLVLVHDVTQSPHTERAGFGTPWVWRAVRRAAPGRTREVRHDPRGNGWGVEWAGAPAPDPA